MRYKVNFHVLLYFLSSCSTMMGSQASNLLSQDHSKTTITSNISNDTKEANTFSINVNNSNHSNDVKAGIQRTKYLASTNDRIATALASNNETNHTKIQTSKLI